MPTIGQQRVQSQTGVITFNQTAAPSGPLSSFTLQTPSVGINLFQNYMNTGGNVTLELCSLAAGNGIRLIPNNGVIYISVDTSGYASLNTAGVVAWNNLPAEVQMLPIAFVIPGLPPDSQPYNWVLPMACMLPPNFAGTAVYAGTIATDNAVFVLNKIPLGAASVAIGTVTITPASNTSCLLSLQASVSFAIGDVLQLVAPVVQDATLADLGITVLAIKV
jgi:hypothetical protein